MRYFITLLVVLSFVASFGSVELESAQIVDSGHFGITAGGMLSVIGLAGGLASIGTHVGVEYGLSEYLSIGLKGDYFHMPTFDDGSFTQGDLSCSLKTSFDFTDPPFSLGFSLGGEYYDQAIIESIDNPDGSNYMDHRYETKFNARGNLIFQAWFAYLGLVITSDFDDSTLPPNPILSLGFDIEFNDNLSMLLELGGVFACFSFGLEFTL
jgi:hypothetical protein